MTDEEIVTEFYIDQEMQKREEAARRAAIPHCPKCGYEGTPYRHTNICPTCGAEMTMPDDPDSDQTTYVDDDFDETVREVLGIEPPE